MQYTVAVIVDRLFYARKYLYLSDNSFAEIKKLAPIKYRKLVLN